VSDIALNSDHDIDVTNGEMSLVVDEPDEPEAIAQECRIALLFHRAEWPLNVLVGFPYLDQVFVKNPSLAALASLFTRGLLTIPGVLEVKEMLLEFDDSTRLLSVEFRVRAQDGGVIEDTVPLLL